MGIRSGSRSLGEFARRTIEPLLSAEIPDELCARLLGAFAKVDRRVFVDPGFQEWAFADVALPIGLGQSISRPSTVAKILAILDVRLGEKVLEVGVGSGYVTALLAALEARVFGIECRGELAQRARAVIDELGFSAVRLRRGDGLQGWPSHAPFDAIVVSTALQSEPKELFQQLSYAGRLVAPVVTKAGRQRLCLWRRGSDMVDLGPCEFVAANQ